MLYPRQPRADATLICLVLCLVFELSCGSSTFAQDAPALTLCDFDATTVPWRSKFTRHEIVSVERDGKATHVLRLPFDLSQQPGYDWVRAVPDTSVQVTPFRYLSFRVRANGDGARMTVMLMRRVPQTADSPNGELVAAAGEHPVLLDFTGWRQLSIPLTAFEDLDKIADRVDTVNFALQPGSGQAGPSEVLLDEVVFTGGPCGEVVPEAVPYPPADIAVASEEQFFGLLDLSRPGLGEVRKAAETRNWPAAKTAWARHLETRQAPRWLWSRRDKDKMLALYDAKFGGLKRSVPAADAVLRRELNWLGVPKALEHDVDWLQGPTEWTHVLSRHQYWLDLGRAWWATGEPKYAEDWVYLLKDWIADNPVPRKLTNSRGPRGTVWRTLETGIRGDLWFDAMELFMDSPQFDAEAKYLMTRSLVEQARHLHRYELGFNHGNWQVVECAGLAAIGIMLPEFTEAQQWRGRAFQYLVEHMQQDVYPDGAHYEVTPGYHSWVMEQFLRTSLLCRLNGYDVPGLMDRHERMFEFLMKTSRPDRRVPALGDAGSGVDIRDHMGMGALLCGRPDMRFLGGSDASPGWVWLFGPEATGRYAALPKSPPEFTSCLLPDSKYCMMRTGWQKDDRFLLLDCAPWGGGHSHQDRLQVIAYAGRDLLVDPGMYSYDQPLSAQYLRKSLAHNVVLVDEQEQPQSDPKLLAWATTEEADLAAGEITDGKLTHRRSVLFVRPEYWVVVDHLWGRPEPGSRDTGEHNITRLFHFPLVGVEADARSARSQFPEGPNILVSPVDDARLEMRKGWIPTGGATAQEAPVAALVRRATLPVALCTVLLPFTQPGDLPDIARLDTGDPMVFGVRLRFGDGQVDEIAIAPEPRGLKLGEHAAAGRALVVREGPRARAVAVVEGTSVGK